MRVIAGSLKGHRLKTPTWDGVRPTSDKLRETLFNILAPRIAGTRVLDGYAGTGALGIEALSRGAASVTFVDRDRRACALVVAHCAPQCVGSVNAALPARGTCVAAFPQEGGTRMPDNRKNRDQSQGRGNIQGQGGGDRQQQSTQGNQGNKDVDRDRMNQGQSQKGGQGSQKGSTNIEKDDDQNEDQGNEVEDDDRITQRSPRQGDSNNMDRGK